MCFYDGLVSGKQLLISQYSGAGAFLCEPRLYYMKLMVYVNTDLFIWLFLLSGPEPPLQFMNSPLTIKLPLGPKFSSVTLQPLMCMP